MAEVSITDEKLVKRVGFINDESGRHYILVSYIYRGRTSRVFYNLYIYDPDTLEIATDPVKTLSTPLGVTTRYEPYMKDVFALVVYCIVRGRPEFHIGKNITLQFDLLDRIFRAYVKENYNGTADYLNYVSLDVPEIKLKKRKVGWRPAGTKRSE